MPIDDATLLGYLDGRLSPERCAEVQAALGHSVELVERLATLRASALPYQAAFEQQRLPPVPERLVLQIRQLATDRSAVAERSPATRTPRRLAGSLAASVLLLAPLLAVWSLRAPVSSSSTAVSAWVQAVAAYQTLYARETVVDVAPDAALSQRILERLRQDTGLKIAVPDLSDAGLVFKRVQRLTFAGQPVVQIVYLAGQGAPVALCVTREARAVALPQAHTLADMHAVTWTREHLGFVLLSKDAPIDLAKLASRLAGGGVPTLFRRAAGAA